MKLTTILTVLPAMALASPADIGTIENRQANSACNPYTDWGHTQGTHSYFCANLGAYPSEDYKCVEYKTTDYCSGNVYCDSSNLASCGGNSICYYGLCVKPVNAKQCQRTCTY
ncbi:hypothetical protein QBC37DRAFT_351482 [Rhypophila decipiens]|uniref:Secreted protein n=1 Tax=Rhypophila decipiens TaxID=261697 RepID=A0AAN6Y1S3_9PEZI|nr:hypothetical protein QBC37DRAFT_351482 [Rhypophila decipiens]